MIQELTTYSSPNHKPRSLPIDTIVLHGTGGDLEPSISWLCDPASEVSSHIVIGKDGSLYRLVDDSLQAWHAGVSQLFGRQLVNGFSLGVEMENLLGESYPESQLNVCAQWVGEKVLQYSIPLDRVVQHKDVAPGRKVDAINFPIFYFFKKVVAVLNGVDPATVVEVSDSSIRVLSHIEVKKLCMPGLVRKQRKVNRNESPKPR